MRIAPFIKFGIKPCIFHSVSVAKAFAKQKYENKTKRMVKDKSEGRACKQECAPFYCRFTNFYL